MKFQVGDKVRLVKTISDHRAEIGDVFTVRSTEKESVWIFPEGDKNDGWLPSRFELVTEGKVTEPGGGMKFDADKVDYRDLLDSLLIGCIDGIRGVVAVLRFGAKKYKPNSWQVLQDAEARYTKALLRHLVDIQAHGLLHRDVNEQGEADANHSGLLSIYHVCCDAMFLAYFATKRAKAEAGKETH